jgi:hypothetical protein
MTTSRSIASTSSRVLLAIATLCVLAGVAEAKKRVVVLDFSGPKADGFQSQIEGIVKKEASLVSEAKWNDAVDDAGGKLNAKTIAKVAAKLNVDGVVTGSVDRRGTKYFVHVKLKSGATGEQVASVELVARSGKLSSDDLGEVRDQIGGAIAQLEAPGDAGDDDEADAPKAKSKSKAKGKHKLDDDDVTASSDDSSDDSADDAPKAKSKSKDKGKDKHRGFRGHDRTDDDVASADDAGGGDDADDAPKSKSKSKAKDKAKAKGKHKGAAADDDAVASDDDAAASDDDSPRSKSKAKGKHKAAADDEASAPSDDERVASRDDESGTSADDEALGASGELARDPQHRPLDALAGFSFTSRTLSFRTTPGLTNKPQGYTSGLPVTGIYLGGDVYPLAFNEKNRSITRDFGLTFMFDRVLSISSQLDYTNAMGMPQTATLGTTEQRLALGVIFRHVLGKKPTDATIVASVRYNRSKFDIDKGAAPMGVTVDIPNTDYSYFDPGVGIRYPISPKLMIGGDARILVVTNTGEVQQTDQYGSATVLGFDFDAGADYVINKQWFVHAALKLTTIGFTFKGNGALSNNRDGNPATIDVQGARDTYYGAIVTAGYLY